MEEAPPPDGDDTAPKSVKFNAPPLLSQAVGRPDFVSQSSRNISSMRVEKTQEVFDAGDRPVSAPHSRPLSLKMKPPPPEEKQQTQPEKHRTTSLGDQDNSIGSRVANTEETEKFVVNSAITALNDIESELAKLIQPLLDNNSYQAKKGRIDQENVRAFISLHKDLPTGAIFSLEQLSANGHAELVISTILPWLPAFLAHKGLSNVKALGSGQPTFDSFCHKIGGYSTTNEAMAELLECIVEMVGLELLLIITSYKGGQGITVDTANHMCQAVFTGINRKVHDSNPILFKAFEESRVPLLKAIIAQVCPDYSSTILSMFLSYMDGRGPSGKLSDAQKLQLIGALDRMSFDLEDADTLREFSAWIDFVTTNLSNSVSAAKKASDINMEFALTYISSIDNVMRGCNFEESKITDPKNDREKAVMTKIEALFGEINLRWSPAKSPHPTLGPTANLLMANLLVRSTLNCYGANLELFLTKRILPLCYKEASRDNALACLLRVLRGPRWADQNAKIRIKLPRVPFCNDVKLKPKFEYGQRGVDHEYSCIMPEFAEYKEALFRPDSLVWIQRALFEKKVAKKVKDMASVANIASEIMLTVSSNSLSPSFIRGLLSYKEHKYLDYFAVGARTVRVCLDPDSGFSEHAAKTRCNRMLDGMTGIKNELGRLLSQSIPEILQMILKDVGVTSLGISTTPLSPQNIIKDGEEVDVYRSASLKPAVNNKLQILQEISNALPFITFGVTQSLIKNGVHFHSHAHVAIGFVTSLQRLMKFNPDLRSELISELVMNLVTIPMADITRTTTLLTMILDNLNLWTNFIENGTDNRSKQDAAKDSEVVEMDESSYPEWTARVEAAAIVMLAHRGVEIRTLALRILRAVGALRKAQFKLMDAVRFANNDTSKVRNSGYCASEFLDKEGDDIVQRALYRYMVDSSGGVEDPFATAFAVSAPPLDKVSTMSSTIWSYALPVIAQRVVRRGHPSVMEETRRQIFSHLTDGGVRKITESKHINDQPLFCSQIELILSLTNNIGNDTSLQINFAGASGGGKWALGAYADPLEKLEQYLSTVWDLTLEKTDPPEVWGDAFAAAMRASSGDAIGSITRSLWVWYSNKKEKEKKNVVMLVIRLLKVLSECEGFVEALVSQQKLLALYVEITSDVLFLGTGDWGSYPNCSKSTCVLNITIVIEKVATAILKANYSNVGKDDDFTFQVKWSFDQRKALYKWLRSSHTWPTEALMEEWGGLGMPLAKSRVRLSKKEENACFKFSSRAVSKMVQMGPVLSESAIERLGQELNGLQAPFHLSWFLKAGREEGCECLQWLLCYHTGELNSAYIKRVYDGTREEMIPIFNAIADNLIPAYKIPNPPTTCVTEDSRIYYKKVGRWGVMRDLGELFSRENDYIEDSALFDAKVFSEKGFSQGDATLIGELELIFMTMQALRDPDVVIRSRSFLMMRLVVLNLMDNCIRTARANEEELGLLAAAKRDFSDLTAKYHMLFSSDSSATLDDEALELVSQVARCLDTAKLVWEFFDAVFAAPEPRVEFGGYDWTSVLLGPFCGLIDLTEDGADSLSEQGEIFVKNLFGLSCQIPKEYSSRCTKMWVPLMRIDDNVKINQAVAHPNVHAIVSFLLYVTAKSGESMHVCQQIALETYKAYPENTASWFTFPLTFEMQHGESSKVYDDQDRALQATSVIILLSGLCRVDIRPLLPFLPSIISFCVLKYPSATRFVDNGDEAEASRGVASVQYANIPVLLFNLLSGLQPLALKKTRPNPPNDIAEKTNSLIAMLKAGKEAKHLVLDWGSSISNLSKPGIDMPEIGNLWEARSFGGVCPRAFMLELIECFACGLADLNSKIGQECLNWALHCRDSYTSTLKAHVLYQVTGKPAGIGTLHALTKEAAYLFAELEKVQTASSKGVVGVGKSSSTAQFQLTNRTMACLNSIEKLLAILGTRVEVTSVAPSTIYLSLTLLKSANSGYDLRFFFYGLRIISQLLGDGGKNVLPFIANCEKTKEEYAGSWSPGFNGIVPLLMPGLLCKDEGISSSTRVCLQMFLSGGASGPVLDESEDIRFCRVVIGLMPYLISHGGNPPTALSVALVRSLTSDVSKKLGLGVPLEKYLAGVSTENFYEMIAGWLIRDMNLSSFVGILGDAFDVAVRYGDKFIIASMLHLSALIIRAGKCDDSICSKISNILTYATNATFFKMGTTPGSITKAGHEVMQAAASGISVTASGNIERLHVKENYKGFEGDGNTITVSSMIGSIAHAQTEKEGQGGKKARMPAPPAKAAPKAPQKPRPPPPPVSEKKVKPPPPPPRRASLVNIGTPTGGPKKLSKKPPPPGKKAPSLPPPPGKSAPKPELEAGKSDRSIDSDVSSLTTPSPLLDRKTVDAGDKVEDTAAADAIASLNIEYKNDDLVAAKDHPDYAKAFKLLSLGVPESQIRSQLETAGLNVAVLEDPEKKISLTGKTTGVESSPSPVNNRKFARSIPPPGKKAPVPPA